MQFTVQNTNKQYHVTFVCGDVSQLTVRRGCNTDKAETGVVLNLVLGIPVVGIADLFIIKSMPTTGIPTSGS